MVGECGGWDVCKGMWRMCVRVDVEGGCVVGECVREMCEV